MESTGSKDPRMLSQRCGGAEPSTSVPFSARAARLPRDSGASAAGRQLDLKRVHLVTQGITMNSQGSRGLTEIPLGVANRRCEIFLLEFLLRQVERHPAIHQLFDDLLKLSVETHRAHLSRFPDAIFVFLPPLGFKLGAESTTAISSRKILRRDQIRKNIPARSRPSAFKAAPSRSSRIRPFN